MRKNLAIGIGMLTLSALPAFAADLPPRVTYKAPAAVYTPVINWTGCYIGGHAGYAWSKSTYTYDNSVVIESFSDNPNSFLGGGQVGCQYQFSSNWVVGVEGTWSWTKLDQADPSLLLPGRQRELTLNQIATVTGRIGYAWDRWMLYAKGGFAETKIDTYAVNPATGIFGEANKWQAGWTVGGGLEYMVTPNFILGAEFNYYRFGFDRSITASDGSATAYTNTRAEVYSAVARASYLFNWGGPVVARY